MSLLRKFLEKGYFPKELPPQFNTLSYANAIMSNENIPQLFNSGSFLTRPAIHNISRKGALRRKLSIPNPVNYFRLSKAIVDNWHDISNLLNISELSMTKPILSLENTERAFHQDHSLNELPELHAKLRSQYKYILKTDISRFYHTIYTHSIPWCLHTKAVAKANRSDALFGNLLDKICRDLQDQQTIGIPIGPDTSLVIAESILCKVDEALKERGIVNGFRYIDDYFLGFKTLSEAESAIAVLQEQLNVYELALNSSKTEIIVLPHEFEDLSISELRNFSFKDANYNQRADLIYYFNKVFTVAKSSPEESIIKYAVSRLLSINVSNNNYPLLEKFLLQCIISDSSSIRYVVKHFLKYSKLGFQQDIEALSCVLKQITTNESVHVHGSEISYCLWMYIYFNINLPEEVFLSINKLRDPFVAILVCDCFDSGLIDYTCDLSFYNELMSMEELKGDMWVFVYEMLFREWFQPTGDQNPILQNECYNFLRGNDVSFYDNTRNDFDAYVKADVLGYEMINLHL
ncbi:RNA-directed DNA polymerase [Enterobacter soli]|uniref:RNA-directed DNA polymerase n=1 Tax=Enterobacter soli TaxID=885040 RepID=UPI002148F61E|nr:RNA-directed DNA polymerase [Enterobacter soli]MCR1317832.1 RNA-directed DNA polymerase [Enterobacter soli]